MKLPKNSLSLRQYIVPLAALWLCCFPMQSFSQASQTPTCENLPTVFASHNTDFVWMTLQAYDRALTNMTNWFKESKKDRTASFEQVKTDLAGILTPIKRKNILEKKISKAQSFKQSSEPILESCLNENKGVTFALISSLDAEEIDCQNVSEFFTDYNDIFIETLRKYTVIISDINQWFQKTDKEREMALAEITANTEDTSFTISGALSDLPLNGSDIEVVLEGCLKKPEE